MPSPRISRRTFVVALAVVLPITIVASLAIGSRALSIPQVWHGLFADRATTSDPDAAIILQTLRLPRTILGILVGMSLGAVSAVIQGHTRNPLADPGVLGINAGAAFAVVLGFSVLDWNSPLALVWLAFIGAALATAAVFSLSRSPLTLVLGGAGILAFLTSITTAISLSNHATLDSMRFWSAGAISGRGFDIVWATSGFMVLGLIFAFANGPTINLLNLGHDVASSLGVNLKRTRIFAFATITLLAGAATAACGPISFVGLIAPHLARTVTGADYRWIIPSSALIGAILLLVCDIIGRLVARPAEVQVGIVVAVVGAPFFIAFVRRRKLAAV